MRLRSAAQPLLVAALLACIVVAGVALRLKDPLSTRALGAEDPYTHVVFVKEWLAQGYFADSFHLGTTMYPPGMHAFVGAFAPLAGVSLYDFARVAPAFFGGLSILGMYALAARLGGQAAGLAAALLMAVTPEIVFRSELLFPTALDLALLPLWLLAFHLSLTGERAQRSAGAVLFVGSGILLAIMHPWLVPLFAAPLAAYAVIQWRRANEPIAQLRLAAALLVAPVAFAMAFRWDESDTGFADFAAKVPGFQWLGGLDVPGPLLFALLLGLLGALAFAGTALAAALPRRPASPERGLLAGVALLALVVPLSRSTPMDVHYPNMLGVATMALAAVGFVIASWRPTPLGDMGASIAAILFPLTALDIFGSPYWPQRTVAYMAVGAVLLGACAVGHAHAALARLATRRAAAPARGVAAGTAVLVALTLALAGGAAATAKPQYTWYRLYDEPHFAGFERVASIVAKDEDARVVIYTWQPALMMKTLADPEHVWYSPDFFSDRAERGRVLVDIDGPAYVLVDKHTLDAATKGKADLGFLKDGSRYQKTYASGDGRLILYKVIG